MKEEVCYDQEWVHLIKEAKEIGLTKEETRLFLKEKKESSLYFVMKDD